MQPVDERAREFARRAHADQRYGKGLFNWLLPWSTGCGSPS